MMTATGPPQTTVRGPPPGLAFDLDEWVPCEAYLGSTERREVDTGTNADLARVVTKLHRRHERDHRTVDGRESGTEVYVKVNPTGLLLRVITTSQPSEDTGGLRDGTREFFETVRIARCSTNHEPCPRALVWVYNRRPLGRLSGTGAEDGLVECHGVVCRDLRDATRLANTMAMAFYKMHEQPVAIGNAFGAVGGAMTMSGLMQRVPGEIPPAYTPMVQQDQSPSRPGRHRRGRQTRVLEIAPVQEDDEDSELDLSPRSSSSAGARNATPRSSASLGNSTVSLNSLEYNNASPRTVVSTRNSTVSLHSAVAVSEGRGCQGSRSKGLPDIAADSLGTPVG